MVSQQRVFTLLQLHLAKAKVTSLLSKDLIALICVPSSSQLLVMELSTVLVTLVFMVALVNMFLYFPAKKLQSCFKSFTAKRVSPKSNNPSPKDMVGTETEAKVLKGRGDEAELKRVFSTFDRDGDGFITKEELRLSLKSIKIFMSEEEIEETVARLDANGDGLIELGEFCELFESVVSDGEVGLKEAFDVFDGDKDGLISVEELGLVLASMGLSEGKKMEACREMIKMVDMDGDGMVNFEEFKKMMRAGDSAGSLASASST